MLWEKKIYIYIYVMEFVYKFCSLQVGTHLWLIFSALYVLNKLMINLVTVTM